MNKKIFLLVIIVAIVSSAVYVFFPLSKDYSELRSELRSGIILHNPEKPLPHFSLIDDKQKEFSNANFVDKWTIVVFGYTNCPDICPTELMDMSMLKSKIAKQKSNFNPSLVMITFDAIRDTPDVLGKFVKHFDSEFVGVSGDQLQIDKVVKSFKAYYERVVYDENDKQVILNANEPLPEDAIEKGYVINHTAWIYLISPDGQIFAGFPTPHDINKMLGDLNVIFDSY
jgi:protein SCO1/2